MKDLAEEKIKFTKNIGEQRQRSNLLEKQVQNRTDELRQQNISLEKINKDLESFTFITNHDLQEPLRKIQIFSELIQHSDGHHISEGGKQSLHKIKNAAKRMQSLIKDLMAYAVPVNDGSRHEVVDLATIVEDVKEDLEQKIEEKQAVITLETSCSVRIINFQFRQLMCNIISNSIKFSTPGIPPHITIRTETGKGKQFNQRLLFSDRYYCRISIADNGIGFQQKYHDQLFTIFKKLHSTEEYPGNGIGLTISKKIVDNHQGIIAAEGFPNNGAVFHVYIPA